MPDADRNIPVHESPSEHVPPWLAAAMDQQIAWSNGLLDESIAVYTKHVDDHGGGAPTMCAWAVTVHSHIQRSHYQLELAFAQAVARIVHLERQAAER